MFELRVNEGKRGSWEVTRFGVSAEEAAIFNLRQMINRHPHRSIAPGSYWKLERDGQIVMSNTPAEMMDHYTFIEEAKKATGHILINGLGLGVGLQAILDGPRKFDFIRVVEKDHDVIELVGDTYLQQDPRIMIIEADAFDYEPPAGMKFDVVWHDIWDNICCDNLAEMGGLRSKYENIATWQGCWAQKHCEELEHRGW